MFTAQFWQDTAERMIRGGANVALVYLTARGIDEGHLPSLTDLSGAASAFLAGTVVPLLLSLAAGRRSGTVSPAAFSSGE